MNIGELEEIAVSCEVLTTDLLRALGLVDQLTNFR